MQIQWYPGHMTKARRMLAENLKLIDVVIELCDARAPAATRNPDFDDLFADKRRVVLLNKSDLADSKRTAEWVRYLEGQGVAAMEMVSTGAQKRKAAIALVERAVAAEVERMRQKGVKKVVRAMVVGIPNVGKSTFINRIAGAARAKVGDRPGVTRSKQWVKVTPYLELMDTPGLLWPKLENETLARHLAYLGSIKDEVMDVEALATHLLSDLNRICPGELTARYGKIVPDTPREELLDALALSRGFLLPGGEPDRERAARIALDEYRACKIARVTLEAPGEDHHAAQG